MLYILGCIWFMTGTETGIRMAISLDTFDSLPESESELDWDLNIRVK